MLVGHTEALGRTKAAATHDGADVEPDRELIAHRRTKILGGLFDGFLVLGRPVQDLIPT